MATVPSQPPTSPASEPEPHHQQQQYWCYHCEKRVSIETLANLPDVICYECKNGFVESIPLPPSSASAGSGGGGGSPSLAPPSDDPTFGSQFLQVLRLLAQSARERDAPTLPPQGPEPPLEDDYLRIELNGWDNDEEDEDENEENRELHDVFEDERDENEIENDGENRDEDDDEEEMRRMRRDVLRLRIRDLARVNSSRNRILDWAEILMGLEDNSIEFRLGVPESDRYIGNPEDYVDAAGYEALLQTWPTATVEEEGLRLLRSGRFLLCQRRRSRRKRRRCFVLCVRIRLVLVKL